MMSGELSDAAAQPRAQRKRVAFLNTHPIQYAAPMYAFFNKSPDIEPVALYLTDFSLRGALDRQFGREVVWDVDLLQGYDYQFVGKDWQTARPDSFFSLRGSGLARAIWRGQFDAIIVHGHNHLASLVAIAAARARGIPIFYKAETHLLLPRSPMKKALRPAFLKPIFSQMEGFLAVSSRNHDFYRELGVPDERIFLFPYAVDNERLVAQSRFSPIERSKLRAQLGLSTDLPVLVYASKLMPRKHPEDVIRAAQELARTGRQLEVLFVGTGELEPRLRALAAADASVNVQFAGFKNQTELPRVLGVCDIFILPSENEPFGLIVNEAMCAGLPVVVSKEVGCVPDLVRDGENGYTYPARQIGGLVAAIAPLLDDVALRGRMAVRSREIIGKWSYEQDLAGLRCAIARIP